MVQFLDPDTAKILTSLEPEIVKMDQQIFGPEIVEMVQFLDPEIVNKSFMEYAVIWENT